MRIFTRGRNLAVFFSAPLDPDSIGPDSVRLTAAGKVLGVERVAAAGGSRSQVLRMILDTPLPEAIGEVEIRFGDQIPESASGKPATRWAADSPIVRVPDEATLTELLDGLL